MMLHGDHGSAWRRRQRRLRSWWRHEQQSQWPCPQPPTTASTRWRLAYGHRSRTGPGLRTRSTETDAKSSRGPELSQLFEEEPGGVWAGSVPDPLPQKRVQRHTAEHSVDISQFVQILGAPVPQMGGPAGSFAQAPRQADSRQVIEVPKISLAPQTAEQLVEVPTDLAYALLALASSVLCGGLQGFLPGQSTAVSGGGLFRLRRTVEQIVGTPVPRGRSGSSGGLQGFSPAQGSTACCGADHAANPVPLGGGLHGFRPGRVSSASSSHSLGAVDEDFTGFYALFPKI